ncbi:MAG TPA: DUF4327 family protein [Leptolyngbyaceae cyanobacterium]
MAAKTALDNIFSKQYTLDMVRDEARQLIERGMVNQQQPIFTLCNYISAREWPYVELELERNDFLLRDRLVDLIDQKEWLED